MFYFLFDDGAVFGSLLAVFFLCGHTIQNQQYSFFHPKDPIHSHLSCLCFNFKASLFKICVGAWASSDLLDGKIHIYYPKYIKAPERLTFSFTSLSALFREGHLTGVHLALSQGGKVLTEP